MLLRSRRRSWPGTAASRGAAAAREATVGRRRPESRRAQSPLGYASSGQVARRYLAPPQDARRARGNGRGESPPGGDEKVGQPLFSAAGVESVLLAEVHHRQ